MNDSTETKSQVHILNGDSLLERFPASFSGQRLVMRECLIDGDTCAVELEKIIAERNNYLAKYDQQGDNFYMLQVAPQLRAISQLTSEHNVYCWFEYDLFCQLNFWFVCWLLDKYSSVTRIYLVVPNKGNEFSFAHMTNEDLELASQNAELLNIAELKVLAQYWQCVQDKNIEKLVQLQKEYGYEFSKIAVQAEVAMQPDSSGLGKPQRVLKNIIDQQPNLSFGQAFQQFCKELPEYSYGDLQVMSMFKELQTKNKT